MSLAARSLERSLRKKGVLSAAAVVLVGFAGEMLSTDAGRTVRSGDNRMRFGGIRLPFGTATAGIITADKIFVYRENRPLFSGDLANLVSIDAISRVKIEIILREDPPARYLIGLPGPSASALVDDVRDAVQSRLGRLADADRAAWLGAATTIRHVTT